MGTLNKPTTTEIALARLVSGQIAPESIAGPAWADLLDAAEQHRLLPMVYWTLKHADRHTLDDQTFDALQKTFYRGTGRFMQFQYHRNRVEAALQTAIIPTLWLKGIALAETVYPAAGLRPMGDLDVLVPFDRREAALTTAQTLGYDFVRSESTLLDSDDTLVMKQSHHYQLRDSAENPIYLEIHFRLLGPQGDRLLPPEQLDWLWSQREAYPDLGFCSLTPEAHLLYLCAHALLQHGEAHVFLLQYFDLHVLITQNALDWAAVAEKAVELEWAFAVQRALTQTQRFFQTPIPSSVLEQLTHQRTPDDHMTQVIRIQDRGADWEKMQARLVGLTWKERIRLIRLAVFPPRAFMRTRYVVPRGTPVWPTYARRWTRQGIDVFWALWNRLVRFVKRGLK